MAKVRSAGIVASIVTGLFCIGVTGFGAILTVLDFGIRTW